MLEWVTKRLTVTDDAAHFANKRAAWARTVEGLFFFELSSNKAGRAGEEFAAAMFMKYMEVQHGKHVTCRMSIPNHEFDMTFISKGLKSLNVECKLGSITVIRRGAWSVSFLRYDPTLSEVSACEVFFGCWDISLMAPCSDEAMAGVFRSNERSVLTPS